KSLGVPVTLLNMGVLRRKYLTPWGVIGRVALWIYVTIQLRQLIQQERIERVYVNSANVVIGPLLRNKSTPLIWHLHEIVERPILLRNFLSFLLRRADLLIGVSKATCDHWARCTGKEVQLVYNGINISSFQPTSHNLQPTTTLGLLGRIQPWKGQHYMLEIMQTIHLQPTTTNLQLLISGSAFPGYEYLEQELLEKINELNLPHCVKFIGYTEDVPAFMSSIDLLVLPSVLPDPLPTVVLEAMAAGKPVLATAQGGALEMIEEHETGRFMPIGNASAAAAILQEMISDPEKMKEMGQKGRMRVQALFSPDAFAQNWSAATKAVPRGTTPRS
ncbi:MAG: glycosyltransferase family 4 protein, partial [Chitinophagaceae bacterium]